MDKDVWLEWQALWNLDPWGGERADLRTGILGQAIYHAMYGAVNRVIRAIIGGTDDFDYDLLPTIKTFMPYFNKGNRRVFVDDRQDADEKDDGRPLDPNTMTPEQWERHHLEISRWKEYLAVRTASQGAGAPGTVPEAMIR